MYQISCFLKTFRNERINESQKLVKSSEKYFCTIFSSILPKTSQEKLVLVRFKIWVRLTNTLTHFESHIFMS